MQEDSDRPYGAMENESKGPFEEVIKHETSQALSAPVSDSDSDSDSLDSMQDSVRSSPNPTTVDVVPLIADIPGSQLPDSCRYLSHELQGCIQYLRKQANPTTIHENGAGLSTAIEAARSQQRLAVDKETSLQCSFELANTLTRRFERVGQSSDLYEAIALYKSCLSSTSDAQRSSLSSFAHNYSYALRLCFELTSELSCLEEAVALSRGTWGTTVPLGLNGTNAEVVINLAECLLLRYRYLCSVSDFEESVSLIRNILSQCPEGHAQRPIALRCIAELYILAYVSGIDIEPIIGHTPNLAEAIQSLEDARRLIAADDDELSRILFLLAHVSYLCVASGSTSPSPPDVATPIRYAHQALTPASSNLSFRTRVLAHIYLPPLITFAFYGCKTSSHRHRQTRIEIARVANEICPDKHVLKPVALMELVLALDQDAWREGNVESIEESIAICESLLKFCPPLLQSPLVPDSNLDSLTLVFEAGRTPIALPIMPRFCDSVLNIEADSEESVRSITAECIPLDIGTLRFVALSTLSLLYSQRHHSDHGTSQWTHILTSLTIGIAAYHSLPSPLMDSDITNSSMVIYMSKLTDNILSKMYVNFQAGLVYFVTQADMRRADLLGHWRNLTTWNYTKEQRWIVSGAIAEVSLHKLKHERNMEGLERYIQLLEIWVSLLAHTNGESEILIQVARAHAFRYELLSEAPDKKDLEKCKEIIEGLMANTAYPVVNRIRAATFWALIAASVGWVESASKAFDDALSLQSKLTFVMDLKVRMVTLKHSYGLPCDAACFELMARGDLHRAIERLEQGRGVLWSQAHSIRMPFHALKDRELANRFKEIAEQWRTGTDFAIDRESTRRREKLTEEWDEVLERIRENDPEMEAYLPGGRTWQELKGVVREGCVVVMLVGDEKTKRCFAIMIRPAAEGGDTYIDLPTSVNLPKLRRLTQVLGKANRTARDADMSDALEAAHERLSRKFYEPSTHDGVLSELWTSVVRPVFTHLALKRDPEGVRPRLWWCPTGPFAFLPIHAAGIYTSTRAECCMDYVVSSYVPTLTTLLIARREIKTIDNPKALIVAAQNAPNQKPLPMVKLEAELVQSLLPPNSLVTINDASELNPIVGGGEKEVHLQAVLSNISEASILHLACHGSQHDVFPDNSSFLLRDGELTLSQLLQLELPLAQFAFLSACDSAAGDESRPDESIHLAAAMLAVGFKSIIGTMWTMDDKDGPVVAKGVYSRIFKNGRLDFDAIPFALDATVRELRGSKVWASRWATYVHMGV